MTNKKESMYFIFADGKDHIIAEGEEEEHYVTMTWHLPYSEIRDYVNEWTDYLREDQEWRRSPYDVAHEFAYGKWKDEPYGMNWAECVKDAIISRLRTSDGYPTSVTYDLHEPMTKAEIRSFLTGIEERYLTRR
jgi:hypothetical protein|tara:strand:- start:1131 stop:1532 length:402 start_codon:yes stop_codon:yes gene_type:complete